MEVQARSWRKEAMPPMSGWSRTNTKWPVDWTSSQGSSFLLGKSLPKGYLENGFSTIEKSIDESKRILELKDDFDGEGSPGYSIATWRRAVKFLKKYALLHFKKTNNSLLPPKILPGPNGSIDIFWKTKGVELLVNFPPKLNQQASFYGDREEGTFIKGNLDPKTFNLGLLEWLLKR